MSGEAKIDVKPLDAQTGHAFEVTVQESGGSTRHRVTVSEDELRRFGGATADPGALVKESLRFLLEREPIESILGSFAIQVIERYFPEYPKEIVRRLGG